MILPSSSSSDLPHGIQRRSQNVRSSCPLYDISTNSSSTNPGTPSDQSTAQPLSQPQDSQRTLSYTVHQTDTLPSSSPPPPPVAGAGPSAWSESEEPEYSSLPTPDRPVPQPHTSCRSQGSDPELVEPITSLPDPNGHPALTASARQEIPLQITRHVGRSRASPDSLVSRHMASLDPHHVYSIPGPSQSPPCCNTFNANYLQPGLLNDGNVCGLISILLCFHRIQIITELLDPHFCLTTSHTPDYPSLILHRVLHAMPSTDPFSIQILIMSWNSSGRRPSIQQGINDIPTLAEALLINMQVKQYSSRPPVFSQFLASFTCSACGKNHTKLKKWESQRDAAIPLIQLPPNNQTANIPALLSSYLEVPIHTRCTDQNCRQMITNARFETETGYFTVISVNRVDDTGINDKKMNRLDLSCNDPSMTGHQVLGELVSCVCHRGDVNQGHFVSYHKVGDVWFLNDDSRPCVVAENPLVQTRYSSQTIDLMFFANIV